MLGISQPLGNWLTFQSNDLVAPECYDRTIEGDLTDPPIRRMYHAPIGNDSLDACIRLSLFSSHVYQRKGMLLRCSKT